MTTKFLDNKISTFKILLSWRFQRKTAFLDDFPLCPQGPPPLKILVSIKFLSAIFWGRRWVRQFYGRVAKCALPAEKPMSINRGGGILGFGERGGGVPILFLWARG